MPQQPLTLRDFQEAADRLRCDVAAIRAVAEVESLGRGFYAGSDEPIILFERHVFHRLTEGKYDKLIPDLSSSKPGGYGASSEQHKRLQRAAAYDRTAALKSASWGQFQIMGFNHALAGFADLQSFINAMYRDTRSQLQAFVRFIQADKAMWDALIKHDWATFARRYNGPAYRENKYDTKLAQAHERFGG